MNPNDRIQSEGRRKNGAEPLNAAEDHGGPERYPAVRKDDAVETGNPQPRQGAGDGAPPASTHEGRLGPGSDPAEGKR